MRPFFLLSSTFCLTDKDSKCLAVNLYNLAPGKGVIIGDTVAIAEPNFSHVSLHIKEQVTFPSAVISIIPLKLFVFLFNLSAHCIWCDTRGKSLGPDYQRQKGLIWLPSRHWIVHFCQKWLKICDTFFLIHNQNNALIVIKHFHTSVAFSTFQFEKRL